MKDMVTSLPLELENLCAPSCRQDLYSPKCSVEHVGSPYSLQCWLDYTDFFKMFWSSGTSESHPGVSKILLGSGGASQSPSKQCSSGSLNSQNSLDCHVCMFCVANVWGEKDEG